jgi:hypothetical protein
MSRWCHHYACTKELLDRFLFAIADEDPEEGVGELLSDLYPVRDSLLYHESNHIWEEIHRALTDDFTEDLDFDSGEYPLRLCIHGGEWLLGGGQTMTLVDADDIPDLCRALEDIDEEWLRPKLLALQGRVRAYTGWRMTEEWLADVWNEFCSLRGFFQKAEKTGLPVICTISQ